MSIKPIVTGPYTYIGPDTHAKFWGHIDDSKSVVRVGAYCSLAGNILFLVDGNHRIDHASSFPFYELGYNNDPRNKNGWGKGAPVVGNDVWIGEGSRIMSGVKIGDGAVVAAYSIVTKDVPPYAIVAGNPAEIKRFRFSQEMIKRFLAVQWWDLPKEFVLQDLIPVQHDPELFLQRAEQFRSQQMVKENFFQPQFVYHYPNLHNHNPWPGI
jgi:acetyltransferase-like isoleucine patch superfamily enzyme